MDLRLEMIHMQLTRRCNLDCWFCGQRKNRPVSNEEESHAMTREDWLAVIEGLEAFSEAGAGGSENARKGPCVMLWGGEPLMSPSFDEVARTLAERGCRVGMVTNGTLLDRHIETVSRYLDRIYVSIDGPEEVHDRIRGKGTFRKIRENLNLLKHAEPSLSILCMAVLTETLTERLVEFYDALSEVPVDELLLQDMIWLEDAEIAAYQDMMRREFSIDAKAIEAWKKPEKEAAPRVPADVLKADRPYPFRIRYLPHVRSGEMGRHCLSPFRHLHVMWNGEACFCTDFTDFSLGNVREQSLKELFYGGRGARFRQLVEEGKNPACRHCSWGDKEDFYEL